MCVCVCAYVRACVCMCVCVLHACMHVHECFVCVTHIVLQPSFVFLSGKLVPLCCFARVVF